MSVELAFYFVTNHPSASAPLLWPLSMSGNVHEHICAHSKGLVTTFYAFKELLQFIINQIHTLNVSHGKYSAALV